MNIPWELERRPSIGRFLKAVIGCVLLPMLLVGCPTGNQNPPTDQPDDGTTNPPTTTVSAKILGYTGTVQLRLDDPLVSVLYQITGTPESASGFYVRVTPSPPDSTTTIDPTADDDELGGRVIIAPSLALTGNDLQFRFDPTMAGPGFYRVGIMYTVGGTVKTIKNTGIISVGLSPEPRFIRPVDAVTEVANGKPVLISFDSGVSSNDVSWRLFYYSASDSRTLPADKLGTEIATGVGATGSAEMITANLLPGEYELGVSVTDLGISIATAVATGQGDRIATIPNATQSGPKIVIPAP